MWGNTEKIHKLNDDYCIGPSWHLFGDAEELTNPMKVKLFHCKKPCGGKKPCVRYITFHYEKLALTLYYRVCHKNQDTL